MPGSEYSFGLTFKHFLYAWVISFIGILIPFTISFVQDYDWPPEVIYYIPIFIAALVAIQNAWVHWDD